MKGENRRLVQAFCGTPEGLQILVVVYSDVSFCLCDGQVPFSCALCEVSWRITQIKKDYSLQSMHWAACRLYNSFIFCTSIFSSVNALQKAMCSDVNSL